MFLHRVAPEYLHVKDITKAGETLLKHSKNMHEDVRDVSLNSIALHYRPSPLFLD